MKKIVLVIAFATVCALVLGLVGCASDSKPKNTPTSTMETALKAIKDGDTATLEKVYAGDVSKLPIATSADELLKDSEFEFTDEQKKTIDKLVGKLHDFDYKVSNEKIENGKAHVDVEVTTYQFGPYMKTVVQEIVTQALLQAWTNLGATTDESNYLDLCFNAVENNMSQLEKKDYKTKFTATLTQQKDGTWKVDELGDAAIDALLGGLSGVFEGLTSTFGELASTFDLSDILGSTGLDELADELAA